MKQLRLVDGWSIVWRYTLLTIGAVIAALSIDIFLAPYNIAPAGVSGLAVIINYLNPNLSIGVLIIIGNIPIQVLGYRYLGGWRVVFRTVYYVILSSVLIDLLMPYAATIDVGDNVLMNALFGGILVGVAGGMVYRAGGTQGGTSTLGRILQQQFGIPLSASTLMTDTLVVFLAGLVFGWEGALYAMVALFVGALAADYVLEGPSVIRTATIITDKPQAIADVIIEELGRGVTSWQVTGMFTGDEHSVLFVTVLRPQVGELRTLVHRVDPDAFLVIGQGHLAYGEGFRPIKSRSRL